METGFSSWNVYRGALSILIASPTSYTQDPGSNPSAVHLCGLPGVTWSDPDTPAPGEVAFYLATGVDGLGAEGDLGTDSVGSIRPNGNPCQ
jgi:hypothetical protein